MVSKENVAPLETGRSISAAACCSEGWASHRAWHRWGVAPLLSELACGAATAPGVVFWCELLEGCKRAAAWRLVHGFTRVSATLQRTEERSRIPVCWPRSCLWALATGHCCCWDQGMRHSWDKNFGLCLLSERPGSQVQLMNFFFIVSPLPGSVLFFFPCALLWHSRYVKLFGVAWKDF